MNKRIAIGAASVALAAMPVAGVFATSVDVDITDKLFAKVTSACSFLRYGAAGATGQTDVTSDPSWDGPTTQPTADNDTNPMSGTTIPHTYSATIKPTADVELGTSTFEGYCNASDGFNVTVVTPDLSTGGASPKTIAFVGTAPNATTGEGWTLAKTGGTLFTNTGADTIFMSAAAATDSANKVVETATYKVYTNSTTKSGSYTANVVYTFTYDDPS